MCVGGTVHVIPKPKMELLRVNGAIAIVSQLLSLEVIARGKLEVAVHLLAH